MTNTFKYMLRMFLPATLALAAGACAVDDGDLNTSSELGSVKKEYIVAAQKSAVEVDVYANTDWQAEFTGNLNDWAQIDNTSNSNDGKVRISVRANDGFARMARLRIFSSERSDTVLIKQRGVLTPELSLPSQNITVLGAGGQVRTKLNTNLDINDIKVEIMYTSNDEGEWIENYSYSNGYLFFDCAANATQAVRNARVKLSFTDGWEQLHTSTLYQTQANKNEEFGTVVGFEQLRLSPGVVAQDYLLEGYIVSNTPSGNAGEQLQNTATNYGSDNPTTYTAYVESLDGRYGFRLKCASAADNIFRQFSKVRLMLKGSMISSDEFPRGIMSFTISGITSNMVLESEQMNASDMPVKQKRISQLTDDDMYTYVTLTDCEFPVRKGSMTPINEGYTPLTNAYRIAKYPLLVRDIEGNNLYMMTNIYCPYRRNGKPLPYGSGNLKGVIVHEAFTRFEYSKANNEGDEMNGWIGRFQIRHQAESDIYDGMDADFKNSFSALAFEMRYARISSNKASCTLDGANGYVTITSTMTGASLAGASDWSYLGPCGNDNKKESETGNPCGMSMLATDNGNVTYTAYLSNDGKGQVTSLSGNNGTTKYGPAIATKYTWDYDDLTDGPNGSADGFLINFSTAGINTSVLSLQIATYGLQNSPRWWKVEWSEGGTKQDTWHPAGNYVSAVAENWNNCKLWNIAAPKYSDIRLPLEMLGKNQVFLRLVPEENATSNDQYFYNTAPINMETGSNSYLFYIGIRYNK